MVPFFSLILLHFLKYCFYRHSNRKTEGQGEMEKYECFQLFHGKICITKKLAGILKEFLVTKLTCFL